MFYYYSKSIPNTEDSRWHGILENSISVRSVEITLDDSNLYCYPHELHENLSRRNIVDTYSKKVFE